MVILWKVALLAFVFLTSMAFLLSTVAFFVDVRRKSHRYSQQGSGQGNGKSPAAGQFPGDRLYRPGTTGGGVTYRMRTRKYIYTPQGFIERS